MHFFRFLPRTDLCAWLLSILSILALSVYGRRLQQQVMVFADPFWLAGAILVVLFFVLGLLKFKKPGDSFHNRITFVALLLLAAGGLGVYTGYLAPIEVIHFLVFSCFGWLSNSVFGVIGGIFSVIIFSLGDEVLQHFLPDRVGDLHDIIINAISGIIGVFLKGK